MTRAVPHQPEVPATATGPIAQRRISFGRPSLARASDWRGRRGFTLVEILLSLALLSVLLAALYGAFDTYSRLSTAGRDDVRQAQIARSLLRMIQSDLQSAVFRAEDSSGAAMGSSGGETGTSDTEEEVGAETEGREVGSETQPTEGEVGSETQPTLGIAGDSGTLMLYVNRPANPSGTAAGEPEIRSVSWFLAIPNSDGIQGAVGNLAAGGGVHTSRETAVMGLARLEGDRYTLDTLDAEDDLEGLASYAKVLAREVNFLQFSYFDGTEWTDTWDSAVSGSLPRAVEIYLGLRPPKLQSQLDKDDRESLGLEETVGLTFRLVVALPAASTTSSSTMETLE